jgi:DNA-directed RNA polymerase subunit RPC12/RpoP
MFEQWPIHTELRDDEILLSFLVRSAFANGSYPHVLFQSWRNSQHSFTSDIDKSITSDAIQVLSKNTGIASDILQKSLLFDLLRPLLNKDQYDDTKSWRYVMHIGARNHRRSFGYGFCPECMAHEASRYYRRHWRLLWHVGCKEHRYQLAYDCPACGTENKPHALLWQAKSVNECSHCGHALSDSNRTIVHDDAIAVAAWMDTYLDTGINTSKWSFADVQEAALTLRQLMSIVRGALRKPYITRNQAMLDWMGLGKLALVETFNNVHEQWPASLREITLRGAWRLLNTPTNELVDICQQLGVKQSYWLGSNMATRTEAINQIAIQLDKTAYTTTPRASTSTIEPSPRHIVEERWQLIMPKLKRFQHGTE